MNLHLTTVSADMREIAQGVFTACDANYYLAGGTALALQIGHRKSVDFDYFIANDIDTKQLQQQLTAIFPTKKIDITFEQKNTLWCLIEGVKVSFITRLDALVRPVATEGMFRLASVRDIAVMKLSAICSREEYKDYFDLACMTQHADARSWVTDWERIYANVDPTSWLVALAAIDSMIRIPLDIFPPYNQIDVKTVLRKTITDITRLF
ncbi:MAG: nucleotidyl transferase AbiEii/AbiGii toxin family protein [Candidatus Kerfeldbacteria bacterium]|nr:nucleotidyl transferase AbiEii/AbiGii toxin family protein [Candidatus Kerfeldbacteria bacterium]